MILYDPHHKDDKAATRWLMARNPRLRAVAVPFADHPATRLFRETETWGPLQRLLLSEPFATLPAAIAKLRRQVRGRSPSYQLKTGSRSTR